MWNLKIHHNKGQKYSRVVTTLHIIDPKNPGAVDEIINLGEYWNEEGMVSNKSEILGCNREVKKLFNAAYRYLSSVKQMQDDVEFVQEEA